MERRFIFREDQDLGPEDFNKIQDGAQNALAHVVLDAITPGRRFAGFAAAATGAAQLTVQPGRFYSAGKVYARDDAYGNDFTVSLPAATKKIATVVVYGAEIDTTAVPREFLLNEETGASEPRVVATERVRVANVNVVMGQENADPIPPVIDAGALAIAQVLLSPAGIVSVTMVEANRLDSVNSLAIRAAAAERFVDEARPKITALGSDIATLKAGIASVVDQNNFGRVLIRLATVEAKTGIPSNATASAADFFLDLGQTDNAFAGYAARVEEGVRFPTAATVDTTLAIFNALNPAAKVVGGMLFPAFTRELRMRSGPAQDELQISSFTYQVTNVVERTVSRLRLRYGYYYTYSPGVIWWGQPGYDYWFRTFGLAGEVFPAYVPTGYYYDRFPYYWADTVEDHYWDKVTVPHAVPGMQVAETFPNANDQWCEAIGLTFTKLAAAGAITLMITETDRGLPDLSKVISYSTVDRANLVLGAETVIPIQPVFLEGGKRYALVVSTAADHWLATTAGENFAQGTLFYVLDGAYQQGDATKDICFSLYSAKFKAARAVIDLNPLQLAGGISEIDILSGGIVPGSTDLTFEVQVSNKWVPLARATTADFNVGGVLPPLIPLRAVFTGSPEVMPAVKTTGSRVRISRSALAYKHISTVRTLPGGGSTSIRVIERLEKFDAAHHTAVAKLLSGAGYATVTAASSFVDVAVEDGGIERTWLFNLGGAITSYRIQSEGTTDAALNTFHVTWRKDYAL